MTARQREEERQLQLLAQSLNRALLLLFEARYGKVHQN